MVYYANPNLSLKLPSTQSGAYIPTIKHILSAKLCWCVGISSSRYSGGFLSLNIKKERKENSFSLYLSLSLFYLFSLSVFSHEVFGQWIQRSSVFLVYFPLSVYGWFKCKWIQQLVNTELSSCQELLHIDRCGTGKECFMAFKCKAYKMFYMLFHFLWIETRYKQECLCQRLWQALSGKKKYETLCINSVLLY